MNIKKSGIAVAVLAFSQFGWAQSSVTLFGIVDASISSYRTKSVRLGESSGVVAPQMLKRSATKLASSGYNTSRLGFRGVEDLGGGLAVGFWLEAPITNDDGAAGGIVFSRRSTLSLSGGFGEVRLGRDTTASFWSHVVFDPFIAAGVGVSAISIIHPNATAARGRASANLVASDNFIRSSNSVSYFLPPTLGGFYGQLQYSLHENDKKDGPLAQNSKAGKYYGARFGYANGPLDLAIAYGQDYKDALSPAPTSKVRLTGVNIGGTYDFGSFKVFGLLSQLSDKQTPGAFGTVSSLQPVPGPTETAKYRSALVGVTIPVGAGLIRASYVRVNYKARGLTQVEGLNLPMSSDTASTDKFAIGYVHNLSKRTALYATVAKMRLKSSGELNPAMAASVGGGVDYARSYAGAQYAPKSSFGYDIGIRHSF